MGKQSGHSMRPRGLEQALGSSPGSCFGLAEPMSRDQAKRGQRSFLNQETPLHSSEERREWDLLHRAEVRVSLVEVHLRSRP